MKVISSRQDVRGSLDKIAFELQSSSPEEMATLLKDQLEVWRRTLFGPAYVRANPGKVNYATGNGTSVLATAQLALAEKLDMRQIPYKGLLRIRCDLTGDGAVGAAAIVDEQRLSKYLR